MKQKWMTAGAFGVATAFAMGCGADAQETVQVEANVGSVQQASTNSTCFNTTHSGAEQWIDAHCNGAGGTYSYSSNDPNGYHCMSCASGGGSSSPPPGLGSSGSPGYDPNPPWSGGGGGSGGGGSTTPPPPDPEPVTEKTKFLCRCCVGTGEWIAEVASFMSPACEGGFSACVAYGDHPAQMEAYADGTAPLGPSGSFLQTSTPTTWVDWLGNDYSRLTFWAQMDDGDSVRFFSDLKDFKSGGTLGTIAGLLPIPYLVSLAVAGGTWWNTHDVSNLADAYDALGHKDGIYVQATETWKEFNPGGDHLFAGEMFFDYDVYLRSSGTLIAKVSGSSFANAPAGHVGEQNIPGPSNLGPPSYYTQTQEALSAQCASINTPVRPPFRPPVGGGGGTLCRDDLTGRAYLCKR